MLPATAEPPVTVSLAVLCPRAHALRSLVQGLALACPCCCVPRLGSSAAVTESASSKQGPVAASGSLEAAAVQILLIFHSLSLSLIV